MTDPRSTRGPRSEAHARLGHLLRQARVETGRSTRDLGYSSGHVSNVERGHVTPSREFITTYVELGADPHAVEALLTAIENDARRARLTQIRAARNAPDVGAPAPTAVTATTRGVDVRSHYSVERYDVEFRLDERAAIVEVTSTVEIRATSADVHYYYAGHVADESHLPRPLPHVEATGGATLDRINQSPIGAWDMFFRLDHPIQPDDPSPHRLTYVIELPDQDRADPMILYLARPGTKHHRLDVRFEAPALPSTVWWFAAADTFEADRPSPDHVLVEVEPGRYCRTFEPLVAGWYYGFTWVWPPFNVNLND